MKNSVQQFLLFRLLKKIFITGVIKILPTLLVISILIIGFRFLDSNIGKPINNFIKWQLAGNWKAIAINVLGVEPKLYEPVTKESYESMILRIKQGSPDFLDAELSLEEAKQVFASRGGWEKIEKKALVSGDPDYARFLEEEIQRIRLESGLDVAEKEYERERLKLSALIQSEKKRLEMDDWKESRKERLKKEIEANYPRWLGIVLAFFLIFLVGMLFSTFIGHSLTKYWEGTLRRLPFIDRIYPYTKQLTEFLFNPSPNHEFDRVVAIEYPRKGIFALGFLTGEGILEPSKTPGKKKLVSIFIPSSPTPFTGYTIMVEESEIIPMEITVEETLRFCVTGGVIKPDAPLIPPVSDVERPPSQEEEETHA